jgi:hypothetical protein
VQTIFTFNTTNKSGVNGRIHVYNRSHICCKRFSETYLQDTRIFILYKIEKIRCYIAIPWRIIVIWIFRKWDLGAWTGSSWLRIRTDGGQL